MTIRRNSLTRNRSFVLLRLLRLGEDVFLPSACFFLGFVQ
jgi:hypothetical protein